MAGRPDPDRAKWFAELAHQGQTYNEDVPYSFHLQKVVEVLQRFGITDPVMVTAAYNHDVIEDSNRSYNDIKKRFGEEVAELVYAVTSELGRNRVERNKKTYPKIKGFRNAVILKLADRIANVEYGMATEGKNEMYAKEFSSFEQGIREEDREVESDVERRMWNCLSTILGGRIDR